MDSPINFAIVRHPMNWVTLFLMVFIAGIAVHLILTHLGVDQTTSDK